MIDFVWVTEDPTSPQTSLRVNGHNSGFGVYFHRRDGHWSVTYGSCGALGARYYKTKKEACEAAKRAYLALAPQDASVEQKLDGAVLTTTVFADENGYIASPIDISAVLQEATGFYIPTSRILLEGPITEVGPHEFRIEYVPSHSVDIPSPRADIYALLRQHKLACMKVDDAARDELQDRIDALVDEHYEKHRTGESGTVEVRHARCKLMVLPVARPEVKFRDDSSIRQDLLQSAKALGRFEAENNRPDILDQVVFLEDTHEGQVTVRELVEVYRGIYFE